ncbi:hypothetical protein ACFL1Y_01765 [Patescibacteria group bacterium]
MKKFKGEKEEIDPKKLIRDFDSQNEKMENFFLGLGVFYNDLKSLLTFEEIVKEMYEAPKKDEVSAHSGSYYGLMVYIQKMVAGTIYEFFNLIEKHNKIIEKNTEFNEIKNKLNKDEINLWEQIVDVANKKNEKASDLLRSLCIIRNKFGFHYDTYDECLRPGYVSRFFGEMKHPSNQKAYYSFGKTMTETRFFFSDASVEEALHIAMGKEPDKSSIDNISIKKFNREVVDTIKIICPIIATLLKHFIKYRRNL